MSTYFSLRPGTNGSESNVVNANYEGLDSAVPMAWEFTQLNGSSGQVAIEGVVNVSIRPPFTAQPQHADANTPNVPIHEGGQYEMERPTARDAEFYIESADCIIRVDSTLFKIHRYFLGRDSSAFQDMFSIPTPNSVPSQNVEGYSDENPIVLHGESVERFRALVSVIYALPVQLQKFSTSEADVERLLMIVEVTNKYHFASIETWAADALYKVISGVYGSPQPQYELGHYTLVWMKWLLEITILRGDTALHDYVVERWVKHISAGDFSPVDALEVADRNGIRRLQGYAYYVQLLEMDDDFEPEVAEDGMRPSLTHEQKVRLLLGSRSLSRLWNRIRANPPQLQQADRCTKHQQVCVVSWTHAWRDVGNSEVTLEYSADDVLGRLRAMERQLRNADPIRGHWAQTMSPICYQHALTAMSATIKEVQEGLADHFVCREFRAHA